MRISDWSSDVCSSDLSRSLRQFPRRALQRRIEMRAEFGEDDIVAADAADQHMVGARDPRFGQRGAGERAQPAFHPVEGDGVADFLADKSEEHTSEIQSLMRISYAVFCLKKKKNTKG